MVSPALDRLDSETMHDAARAALRVAEVSPITLRLMQLMVYGKWRFKDERLKVVVGGVSLENPVMVGAGWDKQGKAVRGLYGLGFSGVEVGTVVFRPQFGNPKPRQWMIGPGVALNRLGFNSPGMTEVEKNLERYRKRNIPIGINIGKNKETPVEEIDFEFAALVNNLYDYASYFAINVSSPNTPGVRDLQEKEKLTDIVQAVTGVMELRGRKKPVFVKISPDMTLAELDDVIEVVLDNDLEGIIAANTTVSEKIKEKYGWRWSLVEGGVSGDDDDYRRMVNEKIRHIYRETDGQVEIVGVGGVKDWQTALQKLRSGAKVVQVVTAIRQEGPAVVGLINRGLVEWMEEMGVRIISDVVGTGE